MVDNKKIRAVRVNDQVYLEFGWDEDEELVLEIDLLNEKGEEIDVST
jgi:plasmid maintenance system killer protein